MIIDTAIPVDDENFPKYDTRFVALGYEVSDVRGYPEGFDWERVKVV